METSNHDLLCRLCGKSDKQCKKILDINNQILLKLVQDLIHLTVTESDGLPTSVCPICEEKLVSFHLFIEQCYSIQKYFKSQPNHIKSHISSYEDNPDPITELKCEVKQELLELQSDEYVNENSEFINDNNVDAVYYDDLSDDMTIASLKKEKRKGKKVNNYESFVSLNKLRDFFYFTCQLCNKNIRNWPELESHYADSHSGEKPVLYCVCGEPSYSQSSLYKHYNKEHRETKDEAIPIEANHTCDECPKVLQTKSALRKHKSRVHNSKPEWKCATCDKIFKKKEFLKSHVKTHIPIEERKCHKCEYCEQKFTTRSTLRSHKKIVHDQVKSYVCDVCGYACGTNGELKQHRAIHSDEKRFPCPKCKKGFKTASNLKTHMDIHEGTSYTCGTCGRVLNTRRTLRKHLLVHQSDRRHVCTYCGKAFKRRQNLQIHLSSHTGDKTLKCKWCDQKFMYASTLRSHRLRAHPDGEKAVQTQQFSEEYEDQIILPF